MKNTILKMAGVKDEKSFYKKYPTEAAFLKAHPKAKTQLKQFALGGIEANRQTYPKTITYSPQEWHQKNILAGNVMLGKNNDLKTMFKNNIYPQYTLPNDTVPINYSPVVKQLSMPQGFVDNSKSTFNYAAGQQLPKQANGGQMNAQAMQQFAGGGVWDDVKEYAGIAAQFSDLAGIGYGEKIRRETDQEGVAFGEKFGDTMASGVQGVTKGALNVLPGGSMVTGLTDQTNSAINKPEYNEDGSLKQLYEGRTKLQKTAGGVGEVVGAVGAGVFTGNVGGATSSGMQGFGKFSEGMDTDSSGERKNSNWATAANTSNSLAPLAGMVGGQFNMNPNSYGFKNSMKTGITTNAGNSSRNLSNPTNMGETQFGLAKYGGQMQYAMGGEIQYANGGTGEINAEVEDNENAIGPNGEFTQFSGPTHAEGGIETDMAPGTMIFSDKLKMPGSKKSFSDLNKLYNTNKEDDVLSSEKSNNTLKLTAMLMRDAKLKQSLALFQEQEQFKQDKVAAYAKRMGVQIPSQDNEQMEPQGMPGQSQGKMAMGGIQESDYQTDPGKLSDIQRQLRVVKQQISVIQPDSQYVSVPLAKLRGLEKDLTIRQNNHPEFKKAMGGRFPMYQYGDVVPYKKPNSFEEELKSNTGPRSGTSSPSYFNFGYGFENEAETPNNILNTNNGISFFNRNTSPNPVTTFTATDARKEIADRTLIPQSKNNNKAESFMENEPEGDPTMGPMQKDKTFKKRLPQYFPEPEGFDWANAGKQAGQFALQNAGNIYDLYRSTQDNSKLNLSRMSPTFLDKTQDLQNNLRLYSEGKRQTAEASQGNASTYLSNMYANRASKLANDLNINTTYGNLNASIDNAAKLYNAGAIDKETMFKLQAEAMNRNLKGQALAGMSQNFLNQGLTNDKNKMDQKTLDFYTKYYNDASFKKMVDENFKDKKPETK